MDHLEVPDRSKSDFYCRICESHMNSYEIWKLHVAGSRHQKNLKKMPGEAPSKAPTKKLRGARPAIQDELDKYSGILIGLSYVCERQASVKGGENLYHCHLCHGSFTRMDLIEHLESVKHKMLFFKQRDPVVFKTIEYTKTGARSEASIVDSYAYSWERQYGREKMEVEVLKSTSWGPPARPWCNAPSKSWLSSSRKLDHRGGSPPPRGSSSRSVTSRGNDYGAPSSSKRSSDGASSSSSSKKGKRHIRLLTQEEVQEQFAQLSTRQKVKWLVKMLEDVDLDTPEDRANAMEILSSVSKLHLLPTYRNLPAEMKRKVRLDLGQSSPPSVSNVMTDVVRGKKSYYFMEEPFGDE